MNHIWKFALLIGVGCGGPSNPGSGPTDDAAIKQSLEAQKKAAESETATFKKQ